MAGEENTEAKGNRFAEIGRKQGKSKTNELVVSVYVTMRGREKLAGIYGKRKASWYKEDVMIYTK